MITAGHRNLNWSLWTSWLRLVSIVVEITRKGSLTAADSRAVPMDRRHHSHDDERHPGRKRCDESAPGDALRGSAVYCGVPHDCRSQAGSRIYSALALSAARGVRQPGVHMIFPSLPTKRRPSAARTGMRPAKRAGFAGVPNQIVALVPSVRVRRSRRGRSTPSTVSGKAGWDIIGMRHAIGRTPGMPSIQWVCVSTSASGSYRDLWDQGQEALRGAAANPRLRAVRRLRRSDAMRAQPSLAGRATRPKQAAANHDRDPLSATNWVRRCWQALEREAAHRNGSTRDRGRGGFPSTDSIASAPYRRHLLDHLVRERDESLADRAVAIRPRLRELRKASTACTTCCAQVGGAPTRERWRCCPLTAELAVTSWRRG